MAPFHILTLLFRYIVKNIDDILGCQSEDGYSQLDSTAPNFKWRDGRSRSLSDVCEEASGTS